jgi:hypothetical protein
MPREYYSLSYDPYTKGYFFIRDSKKKVKGASHVALNEYGMFACNIT